VNGLALRFKGGAALLAVIAGIGLVVSFNGLPEIGQRPEDHHATEVSLYLGNTQGGMAQISWSVTSSLRGRLEGSDPAGSMYPVPFNRNYVVAKGEKLTIHFAGGFNVISGRSHVITCSVNTDRMQLSHDQVVKDPGPSTSFPRDVNCSTWVVHP